MEPGYDLSIVMPCYNEEEIVAMTVRRLASAFERAGYRLQLVTVDNGSKDATGEILAELAEEIPGVTPMRVEVNQGYGYGVLQGFPRCTAPWVGIIPADGQVDPEDVVKLFEAAAASTSQVIAKVRRRFRMDGLLRKVVSGGYNFFMRALWPTLQTLDVNGSPKLLRRELLERLELVETRWCLDPEMMVKAHYMGARVLELNVFARMRGSGLSHVRAQTSLEFMKVVLALRFSDRLGRWKRGEVALPPVPRAPRRSGPSATPIKPLTSAFSR